MKQEEARRRIFAAWEVWVQSNPQEDLLPGNHMLNFFAYLQTDRPELLAFRCRGEKWQTVHGWLSGRGVYY